MWALLLGRAGNQVQRQVGPQAVRCALGPESKELGCKRLYLLTQLSRLSCLVQTCIHGNRSNNSKYMDWVAAVYLAYLLRPYLHPTNIID